MSLLAWATLLVTGQPAAPGPGPLAAPSGGSSSEYGGPPSKVRLDWVNGDATAYTRIYINGTAYPADLHRTVNPGITSDLTGLTWQPGTAFLKHYKDGQESAAHSISFGTL